MLPTALELPQLVERLAAVLAARPEILEAYLFGSVARGEAQAHSDVDVAVFTDAGLREDGAFGYRAELTAALMSALGSNAVDVVLLDEAPPLLYHRVLRDGVRILSRDLRATTVREGRALSRYCDYLPQLDKIERGALGGCLPERGAVTPGASDVRTVQRHLLALRRALEELRRHQGRPIEELAELDELWTVERGLQLAAQNALDIATHIAASAGRDVSDYASAIDALADLGVLEREFAQRFRGIAGFRNVLVHGYLEVDREILHRVLNTQVDEIASFAARVESYLGVR